MTEPHDDSATSSSADAATGSASVACAFATGEAEMDALTVNGVHLVDFIVADNVFINELAVAECIAWSHEQHLIDMVHLRDRSIALLEFLTHGSVANFNKFVSVLSRRQPHLVPLLTTSGVVVVVAAELDNSSLDDVTVAERQDRIVAESRTLLPLDSPDQMRHRSDKLGEHLWSLGLHTRLILLSRADNISLYLSCMSLSAVMSLRDQWCRGRLRHIVESLFTIFLGVQQKVHVERLTWPLTDYERCLDFFDSEKGEKDISDNDVSLSLAPSEFSVSRPQSSTMLSDLPVEMLEAVLMRSFWVLYSSDFEGDDDRRPYMSGRSLQAECRAFRRLSSVCCDWHMTLSGWPHSPTSHWLRHQLRRLIERCCSPFCRLPRLHHTYELDVERVLSLQILFTTLQMCEVESVTHLHGIVYVLCSRSSTILRFNSVTHESLTGIDISGFMSPHDITACEQTSQLYVADFECVWRVSSDGATAQRWLPRLGTMKPWTISVTAARLLVTSPETRQLIQFDSVGNELRRIQLPQHILPRHAVESPSGTLVMSCSDTELDRDMVSVVSDDGQLLRRFSGCQLPSLRWPNLLETDSRGRIFLADTYNRRILLLDAQLALRRVIIDERQLNYKPLRGLCYVERTGHLLVALHNSVAVFDLLL